MYKLFKHSDTEINYKLMLKVIKSMLEDESDVIANFANISSAIKAYTAGLNWAGFYIIKNGVLVLGPFQGMPACVRIEVGKGVCGTAVLEQKTISVKNVNEFPGHIACDSNSKSELVVPLFCGKEVFGVLDLDSPEFDRFGELEENYFNQVGQLISNFLTQTVNVN